METVVEHPTLSPRVARKWRVGLAWQILIGLLIGIATGLVLNHFPQSRDAVISGLLQPAGDIFIKLIKMIVVPIVFTSMVIGIAGVGDGKSLGRIGVKTLVYFEVITTIAIVLGLVLGNVLQPGCHAKNHDHEQHDRQIGDRDELEQRQ
jgi:proton glutamate symport protein